MGISGLRRRVIKVGCTLVAITTLLLVLLLYLHTSTPRHLVEAGQTNDNVHVGAIQNGAPDSTLSRVARLLRSLRLPLQSESNANMRFGVHAPRPDQKYPSLLCFVTTDPALLKITAHARDTWTRRCDSAFFFSSQTNASFPTVGVDVPAGRAHTAGKSRASWNYVHAHHAHQFDYFLKADPDTYMVIENLKEYLLGFNPDNPEYFGHMYRFEGVTYMAGGPGIVISRAALNLLVTKALRDEHTAHACMPDGQSEDLKVARCLQKVGARPVDTRDENGRERFFVIGLRFIFQGSFPQWYRDRDRAIWGKECCSDFPIGFHYVNAADFIVMEYFLYHARTKFIDPRYLLWKQQQ